jgi:hypothetical protein
MKSAKQSYTEEESAKQIIAIKLLFYIQFPY